MMKKIALIMILFSFSVAFGGTINIAVAANVSYAINTLKKEFNTLYPDTKVQVTLGGSGKLTAQILHGAPYQLFMSANMQYPKALYEKKVGITRPLVYAKGSLAYLSVQKRDFTKGLALLSHKDIDKIAVANPKTAPYGKATVEALQNSGLYEKLKAKYVFGESISATVSYTVSAADIGFIAKSALYAPVMAKYKENIHWREVDPRLYIPIEQGIIVLKNAEANSEVAAFYAFMFSDKAQKILHDFGYLAP